MQIEGHQRVAGAFHLADQALNLGTVHEHLAGAHRVGMDVRRGGLQRADVRADQHQRAALHDHIGLVDLDSPGAYRFHLPAFEDQPGLVAVFDEIVVSGFAVFCDAHGALYQS